MFKRIKSEYSLEPHLIALLTNTVFYAEVSRRIKKIPTDSIPTAAVCYNPITEDIVFGYNPEFCKKQGNLQTRGLIEHELDHVILGHITTRTRSMKKVWNYATDLAINSLIDEKASNANNHRGFVKSKLDGPLPFCALIPGKCPIDDNGVMRSSESLIKGSIGEVIANLPKKKSSDWYYEELIRQAEKQKEENKKKKEGKSEDPKPSQEGDQDQKQDREGDQPDDQKNGSETKQKTNKNGQNDESDQEQSGQGGGAFGDGADQPIESTLKDGKGGSLDDHDFWEGVTDETRDIVEGKIREIVESAVREADQSANGWGDIPAETQALIRKSISKIINWRQVLRQFVGTLIRGRRRTSIKRINKRYPYIHPGITKGYTAKLLICIDQSGSVSEHMLQMFFAELRNLNKNVEIDILPFDCYADIEDVYTWRRGACPVAKRTKIGGTCFDAPTNVVNDPKNRGRWDGYLIMTDGMAPAPGPSRVKRGWVLGQGCKLEFNTSDIQIKLDDGKNHKGNIW